MGTETSWPRCVKNPRQKWGEKKKNVKNILLQRDSHSSNMAPDASRSLVGGRKTVLSTTKGRGRKKKSYPPKKPERASE